MLAVAGFAILADKLQPFVVSDVGNVFVIECADGFLERGKSLFFEPSGEEVEHFAYDGFSVDVEGRAKFGSRCAGQNHLHEVFGGVYAGRGGQRQFVYLSRDDAQPAQGVAQLGRGAERVAGNEAAAMNVDVGLPRTVEEYHAGGSGGTQLVDNRHQVGEVAAYLHRHGNFHGGFYFLQNLDVEFSDGAGTVFGGGVDFLYVQLDGVGTGFFEVGGEALPAAVVVAVDAGDDGD